MASTYLTKTFGSHGDRTKWTWSAWIKRSGLGSSNALIGAGGGSNQEQIYFDSSNKIDWWVWSSDTYRARLTTNRLFRDTSGYYHIVCRWDSSNGTTGDRQRIYVNGVEETSFGTDTNPDTDRESWINSTTEQQIGASGNGSNDFNGIMSHIHFCDGQSYAPTEFGSIDATSGEWKINTSPSVTYGDNGYFILKNGNSLTDQSGESNDFTLAAGTLTDLQDCPDDVFATLNPLANQTVAGGTFTTGNNTWQSGNSYYSYMPSTIGVAKGKFYWEVKVSAMTGATEWHQLGISSSQPTSNIQWLGKLQYDYSYYGQNGYKFTNNTGTGPWGDTYGVGDIVSVALDMDNLKVYFAKNGTWQDSGDPTSGATGTGAAYTIENPTNTLQGCYFPSVCYYDSSTNATYQTNFGNGYFGTTIISSEGTNASGIGKFEYDVPTGYTALSLKGLQE